MRRWEESSGNRGDAISVERGEGLGGERRGRASEGSQGEGCSVRLYDGVGTFIDVDRVLHLRLADL